MSLALARVREFLEEYGERAALVLKAALQVTDKYRAEGKNALGDFDYKGLTQTLKLMGVEYKPSLLLSKLEKEYGIIETTYKSGNQHWWRFVEEDAVREALEEEDEVEDPKLVMLKVQAAALGLEEIKGKLKLLLSKKRLSASDKKWFRNFAFETLPLVAKLAQEVVEEGYEDPELLEALRVLKLSLKVASKLKSKVPLDLPSLEVEE
ncbi:hypothetical protein [Ignicoccus hospitalis]|uniref:Uncharacterized protein n=1 Tax=Ignicoccus hospitalis (strain KIN4/I / DSM 18386 / JCM 14125) TaxID=453591 RepID=A8A9U1_IGNH4|nr:hypothetical protein [Ignicoccus hospitalis]ABU81693.1 hypothetical protein Igni_0510 [Ignicoccus hospitalis KIN4/I]HIH89810.1 hypothetical protein [Desulfurococcaceae archaeon]